jgi:hypothetical protein
MAVSSLVPASAGPTIGEINTSVSTYSKGPLDITWTTIAQVNPNLTSTQTITGLGGYKYLKIMAVNVYGNTVDTFLMRFNGDTTARAYAKIGFRLSGSNGAVGGDNDNGNAIGFYPVGTSTGQSTFSLEIQNPTQTSSKKVGRYFNQGWDGGSWYRQEGDFIWQNNAAVTSVTIIKSGGGFFTTDGYLTDGFHVLGGN